MTKEKISAREKILLAAQELAHETGAGHLSLDAVAARADVSKGGLLYHFPSKAKLLEALVEGYLRTQDEALKRHEQEHGGKPNSVATGYLDLFLTERACKQKPPSGVLAALAEDPSFIAPVRRFERDFLDRMKANASDPTTAVIVFLALHGIQAMKLLMTEVVDEQEVAAVAQKLRLLLNPA